MNVGMQAVRAGIKAEGAGPFGGRGQQIGGLTLLEYAEASAVRERLFDEARIAKSSHLVTGDLDKVWMLLTDHARGYAVPFRAGDIEQTNRIVDWDRLILLDADVQRAWRTAYSRALVQASGVDPDSDAGSKIVAHLKLQPELLKNCLMPLSLRKVGVSFAVAYHARDLTGRVPTPPPPRLDADTVVFPGEKIATLKDHARLQSAIAKGDFMGSLYRVGLNPVQYARISKAWSERLAADPALRAAYAMIGKNPFAAAKLASTVLVRPTEEAEIFPGEPLSKVSDFARISRAAQRGEFRPALARAGVDMTTFAKLADRFNAKMRKDPTLETQFRALLKDTRLDAVA